MLSGLDNSLGSENAGHPGVQTRLAVQNRLLQLLPAEELSAVLAQADRVELRARQVLQHWKLPIEHAYFLQSGLVSVAAKTGNDRFVEVWLIGSDGCVGVPLVLAPQAEPLHRRTVQVGGEALRIPASSFRELSHRLPTLRAVLGRYLAFLFVQTSQCGACNLRHPVKERLARWLLLARKALAADDIPLTHEAVSQLLGVRRASITECLEAFQSEGLIGMRRRFIRIEDAQKLEHMSCHCFGLIDREYRRQITFFSSRAEPSAGRAANPAVL